MGTRTRSLLNPVELERQRMQAADLFEQGMRQSRVAEVLGVTPQAVNLWRRAWPERSVRHLPGPSAGRQRVPAGERRRGWLQRHPELVEAGNRSGVRHGHAAPSTVSWACLRAILMRLRLRHPEGQPWGVIGEWIKKSFRVFTCGDPLIPTL
ncbi:helix-turn-helix domain-containing protein [Streptomyces sp. NPDC057909]|uniref:helix-turn-helix domain-containing protein n=1 Tax=Streptomyces sp. NPDC057909 TaxID=3346277 RepID=UPI0036E6335A